ncbi:hypothetical protein AJ78_07884 [Emergomyces pasteurianus Ep9510]|uniref:Uncharacterized protein n=1 Tax=Emergomyces pasteurianus Ep9510 TaxID=1447872 RepID=A0A1J9P610_9EURO|nr:hypothetical protein AJ78_07884 [Emergomyces pasteurianus Ep9510]
MDPRGEGGPLYTPGNGGPSRGARLGLHSPGIEARHSSQQYPRTKSENRTHAATASLPRLSHANHRGGEVGGQEGGYHSAVAAYSWPPEEKDKGAVRRGHPQLPTKGR